MKRVELFNDHFQNFKVYGIPHAQLIIADPPYNLGNNAYASNPAWYVDGDNKNGESELAGKEFFDTDKDFRPAEFMHFCSQMLVKELTRCINDRCRHRHYCDHAQLQERTMNLLPDLQERIMCGARTINPVAVCCERWRNGQ